MKYLNDKDYELADKNGISRSLLYSRFYVYGWDKERAITQPKGNAKFKKPKRLEEKWYELAKKNNIKVATMYWRLDHGWDINKAATTPTGTEIHKRGELKSILKEKKVK